ncbi:MAG TPA: hypothetical protein VMW38_27490 [Terriglobia bacterium]|nr:hypothetical protein [Terriglobia bacterium]
MKKVLISLCSSLMFFLFQVQPGLCWGSAVHAYVADHLGKKIPLLNVNEVYGAMAPDVFNYMFDNPALQQTLVMGTHYESTKVWEAAKFPTGKALAFGFVCHNELFGADHTAHLALVPGYPNGYVIEKATILRDKPTPALGGGSFGLILTQNGITDPDVQLTICHTLTEFGLDVMMKRVDPRIGQKMASAALLRSSEMPLLLVKAYGDAFPDKATAAKVIFAAEQEFRKSLVLYGQALTQDDQAAVQLLAEQLAQMSASYLALYKINVDPNQIVPLIQLGMGIAMENCQGDFVQAISETVQYVDQQMKTNQIQY